MSTSHAAGPIPATERIQLIDILRGFALFGILLVNMEMFSHPVQLVVRPVEVPGFLDAAATFLVRLLAESKFFSLFSFLFGLGFSIQMLRADERGTRFGGVYLRRLLALLMIGLIHAFLFWVGDILIIYALLGGLLLLFRKAKPRTLLIWMVIFLALPILFNLAGWGLLSLGRMGGPEVAAEIDATLAIQDEHYLAQIEQGYQVYANGTFAEITRQRIYDYTQFIGPSNLFIVPSIFAMFLLGLYFGKRRIFQNLPEHLPLFRKLLRWGWTIGLVGNLLYAVLIAGQSRANINWQVFVGSTGQNIGAPLLMLAYVSTLVLLYQRPDWQKRLAILAPLGRMALTNYLLQTVICTLIFYGYGLGLFGQMGKAAGVLLTIVIYALQIPFSAWWMSRFAYGPMEWLWRYATYLRRPPFRKVQTLGSQQPAQS